MCCSPTPARMQAAAAAVVDQSSPQQSIPNNTNTQKQSKKKGKKTGKLNKRYLAKKTLPEQSQAQQERKQDVAKRRSKLNPSSDPFIPKFLDPTPANVEVEDDLSWMAALYAAQQQPDFSMQEVTGSVIRCTDGSSPFALALKPWQHPLVDAVQAEFGQPIKKTSKPFSTQGPSAGGSGTGRVKTIRGNWGFIHDPRFPDYDLFFHMSEVDNKSRQEIKAGSRVRFQVVADRNQQADYARVKASGIKLQKRKQGQEKQNAKDSRKKASDAASMHKEKQSFP